MNTATAPESLRQLPAVPVDRDNAFHSASDCDIKEDERRKVREFILPRVSNQAPKFIGLPGLQWTFERSVMQHDDRQWLFRGAERSYRTFERGLAWAPRSLHRRPYYVRDKNNIVTMGTDLAQIKHCSFSAIVLHQHVPLCWKNSHAMWLDFTGPVGCGETIACIRGLPRLVDKRTPVPVVITVLQGRDVIPLPRASGPLNRRVAAVEELLGNCWTTCDAWRYTSASSPMTCICGELSL